MKKTFIWCLNAAIFIAVGAAGYKVVHSLRAHDADNEKHAPASGEAGEHAKESDEEPASHVSHDAHGNLVIKFDAQMQQHVSIKAAALTQTQWRAQTRAYGALVEDPAESFSVRAPLAGLLSDSPDEKWPVLGATISAGRTIGKLTPRLTPLERLDFSAKLSQARADVETAAAALAAAQSSYDSKVPLNKKDQIISDRTLEEAHSKVIGEQARLESAREIVKMFDASQRDTTSGGTDLLLKALSGGEVVESPVSPGEAVEAGQLLLRTARYNRLLARIELPVGEHVGHGASEARVATVDAPDRFFTATGASYPPTPELAARHRVVLFHVDAGNAALRPGMAVVAYLAAGEPESGVIIPRSAAVRLSGRTWAYVQTGDETFTRRELDTAQPTDDGWFCAKGFAVGDKVVVDGAVALVSEELKPQIELEDGG